MKRHNQAISYIGKKYHLVISPFNYQGILHSHEFFFKKLGQVNDQYFGKSGSTPPLGGGSQELPQIFFCFDFFIFHS